MPTLWWHLLEDLELVNGHLLDQVLRKSGILPRIVHKEPGTTLRKTCCYNSQKADIPFSVQQLHCPGVFSKVKDEENCLYISPLIKIQLIQFIALFFLSISSVSKEQWQLLCEEFEDHQDTTGQPVILVGQSIVLGEVKAEVPVHDEDPRNDHIIWQQYIQQVESLSPENRVSKFCKEAGFMRVVEVGQHFVTKDTGDFKRFRSVACPWIYSSTRRSSFTTKWLDSRKHENWTCIGSHNQLHVRKTWNWNQNLVNDHHSQSWVGISYGTVKYVIDSNHNNTEIHADPLEAQTSQTSVKVIAGRSQGNPITDAWKKMDWHWSIWTISQCVRSLEESNQSSSTQSNGTAGRRWSNSILEN